MNALNELLACPFCGAIPSFPDGYGTQYEIECDSCGMAHAEVQISDLMTIEERCADTFKDFRYDDVYVDRAKREAIKMWNTRAG